jgi:hypothetical protein
MRCAHCCGIVLLFVVVLSGGECVVCRAGGGDARRRRRRLTRDGDRGVRARRSNNVRARCERRASACVRALQEGSGDAAVDWAHELAKRAHVARIGSQTCER